MPVKTLPGLNELISGDVNLAGQLRPVQVEDVLGREPVEVDLDEVAGYLARKTVLVTGAGGSIGAELCRQIARVGAGRHRPRRPRPSPRCSRSSASSSASAASRPRCRCSPTSATATKMRQVFEKFRPDVVFHAAAYKHVPLLEANPLEAVRNNVLATRTLADVAVEFEHEALRARLDGQGGASRRTLLGQSKAICEWIVQAYGSRDDVSTRFVAVRFGNVLGSSGSVIPIFRRQIERGGPVTVTHPRHDALLHDDPRGRLADRPGRRDRRPRRGLRARHGRAGVDLRAGREHDPPLRQGARARHRDPRHRRARPARSCTRCCGTRTRPPSRRRIRRSSPRRRRRSTRRGSTGELRELERLVEDGETLELVARLNAMARAPQRVAARRARRHAALTGVSSASATSNGDRARSACARARAGSDTRAATRRTSSRTRAAVLAAGRPKAHPHVGARGACHAKAACELPAVAGSLRRL